MYYGTIAKYTLKPGHEKQFMGDMEGFEESPPAGWIYHTIFRSTTNPNEIWMSVVFESEAAYKKNADSPDMDKEYRRMLEHLEHEPEWHDGNVIHEAMRKSAPA
jgi:quinol monooxygenase YgiN